MSSPSRAWIPLRLLSAVALFPLADVWAMGPEAPASLGLVAVPQEPPPRTIPALVLPAPAREASRSLDDPADPILDLGLAEARAGGPGAVISPVAGDPIPLSQERIGELWSLLPEREGNPPVAGPARPGGPAAMPRSPDTPAAPATAPDPGSTTMPAAGTGRSPLEVLAIVPAGQTDLAVDVTVLFSNPMVPLGLEGEVAPGSIPARLEPQPPGRWRWVDVRTLRFEPDAGRLPHGTAFEVEVAAGATDVLGGSLDAPARAAFRTAAPLALGGYPPEELTRLTPVILLVFDQVVDPDGVLGVARLSTDASTHPLRRASEAELEEEDPRLLDAARDAGDGRWVALRPVDPLPAAADVVFRLGPALRSPEGPLPAGRAQELRFRTRGPLELLGSSCPERSPCSAGGLMRLGFSNPLDPDMDYGALVRVDPEVDGLAVAAGARLDHNWLNIAGNFEPYSTYRITVEPGVRDRFGQTLATRIETRVFFGAPDEHLRVYGGPFLTLDPRGASTVEVSVRSIAEVEVELYRVRPEDWNVFLGGFRGDPATGVRADPPGVRVLETVVRPTGADGGFALLDLDVSPALEGGRGHAVLRLRTHGTARERDERVWVQATSIGVGAFWDAEELVVRAASLADGTPFAAAEVLLMPSGRGARTDADGIARVALSPGGTDSLVVVRHAGETVVLPGIGVVAEARSGSRYDRDVLWSGDPTMPRPAWFTFTDRRLVQPGEPLRGHGWLRELAGSPRRDLALPVRADSVGWRLLGPRQERLADGVVPVSATGAFHVDTELGNDARSGPARFEFQARSGGEPVPGWEARRALRIERFRRPEYQTRVEVDPGPHLPGSPFIARLAAQYFDGPGLPGAPVIWRVYGGLGAWHPPSWDRRSGWTFATRVPSSDDTPFVHHESRFEGHTDGEGGHALTVDPGAPRIPFPVHLTLMSEVQDVSLRVASSRAATTLHPAALAAGLRLEHGWVRSGESTWVEVVAVDLEGGVRPEASPRVTVEPMVWVGSWFRRTLESRGPAVEVACARLPREELPPGPASILRCPLTADSSEGWRIAAEVTDEAGRTSRTEALLPIARGARGIGRALADPADRPGTIEIVPQQERYAPGDTARLLLTTPTAPAVGTLVVIRHGIREVRPLHFDGPTAEVALPIHPEDAGGFELHAHADAPGGGAVLPGQLRLPVDLESRRLEVRVAPDRERVAPGSEVQIEIEAHGADGAPAAGGEATVWVVDEAVLALGGDQIGDPLEALHTAFGRTRVQHLTSHATVRWARSAHGPGVVSARLLDAITGAPVSNVRGRIRIAAGHERDAAPIEAAVRDGELILEDVPAGTHVLELLRDDGIVFERTVSVGEDGVDLGLVLVRLPGDPDARIELAALGLDLREAERRREDVRLTAEASRAPEAAPTLREVFRALAAFEPSVSLDANGRGQVRIRLPDTVTRYRIFVIAGEGAARFGSAEASLTATRALVVRASPPARLRRGDEPTLPVTIQNATARDLNVEVAARTSGVSPRGPQGFRVHVPAGDRREVRFEARAAEVGVARLEVVAQAVDAGSEAPPDAIAVEFSVDPVLAQRTVASYAEVTAGSTLRLPVELPNGADRGPTRLEVSLSTSLLHPLVDLLRRLCVDPSPWPGPTAARLLAVAALDPLLDVLAADDLPDPAELRRRAADDVDHLVGWMRPWWQGQRSIGQADPGSGFVHSIWILQAFHALQVASDAGYPVPEHVLAGTDRAIARFLESARARSESEARQPAAWQITTLAYAMALSAHGNPEGAVTEARVWLARAAPDELPIEALGWFLRVTALDPSVAADHAAILRTLENRAVTTPATATFRAGSQGMADPDDETVGRLLLASDRRADAVALEALVSVAPDHRLVPLVVRSLVGHRDGSALGSLDENGWVLLALSTYARAVEGRNLDGDGATAIVSRTSFAGERLGEDRFDSPGAPPARYTLPLSASAARSDLIVERDGAGDGIVYVRSALRYAPEADGVAAEQAGFLLSRRYEGVDDPGDAVRDPDGTWRIRAGARVRVRLSLAAPARRLQVELRDPVAGGFEIVNPGLRGTGFADDPGADVRTAPAPGWVSPAVGGWLGWDWESWIRQWRLSTGYGWATHEERRADEMRAYAALLPAGTFETTYLVRATAPGRYVVPPALVEELDQPETFARTGLDRVVVEVR